MGYHSADYDHDWNIDATELARVVTLAGTTNDGVVTGCYKVDNTTVDGFAPAPERPIDEPVTLTIYHSADYNRDGRIDAPELARVQELYDYGYTNLLTSATVRTGQYHDNNPFGIDGFGLGPVALSDYSFDEGHLPLISTNSTLGSYYVLRAKMIASNGISVQTTTTLNNNGLPLDSVPVPGIYRTELYWVAYDADGISLFLGDNDIVWVTIGEDPEKCRKSQKDCICGSEPPVVENVDKGRCFPYRVKLSCNAPDLPVPQCNDREAYVVSTPNETPKFYVVARLFDSQCRPILDQDDNSILTIIK